MNQSLAGKKGRLRMKAMSRGIVCRDGDRWVGRRGEAKVRGGRIGLANDARNIHFWKGKESVPVPD